MENQTQHNLEQIFWEEPTSIIEKGKFVDANMVEVFPTPRGEPRDIKIEDCSNLKDEERGEKINSSINYYQSMLEGANAYCKGKFRLITVCGVSANESSCLGIQPVQFYHIEKPKAERNFHAGGQGKFYSGGKGGFRSGGRK